MNHTEFAVTRFENRNGVTSWRVAGWLAGVRIRKNVKTREEAATEKSALEIKALQASSGFNTIATTLTAERMRAKPKPCSGGWKARRVRCRSTSISRS